MKGKLCRWKCGGRAPGHSGICEECWSDRATLFAARKAEEAAKPKKVLSEAVRAKIKAAHKAHSDAKTAIQATLGEKG